MNFGNDIVLLGRTMGKFFRIRHVTKSVEEANKYCEKHKDCAVLDEEKKSKLIFIAEKEEHKLD